MSVLLGLMGRRQSRPAGDSRTRKNGNSGRSTDPERTTAAGSAPPAGSVCPEPRTATACGFDRYRPASVMCGPVGRPDVPGGRDVGQPTLISQPMPSGSFFGSSDSLFYQIPNFLSNISVFVTFHLHTGAFLDACTAAAVLEIHGTSRGCFSSIVSGAWASLRLRCIGAWFTLLTWVRPLTSPVSSPPL